MLFSHAVIGCKLRPAHCGQILLWQITSQSRHSRASSIGITPCTKCSKVTVVGPDSNSRLDSLARDILLRYQHVRVHLLYPVLTTRFRCSPLFVPMALALFFPRVALCLPWWQPGNALSLAAIPSRRSKSGAATNGSVPSKGGAEPLPPAARGTKLDDGLAFRIFRRQRFSGSWNQSPRWYSPVSSAAAITLLRIAA